MPATSERVSLTGALRDTGFTALISFGLLLPLVGFQTVTDFQNNLIVISRARLLVGLVIFIAIARFVFSLALSPYLVQRRQRPSPRPRRRAHGRAAGSCPSPSPSSFSTRRL